MDLNTKLEDELLFSSEEKKYLARKNRLISLGINTIGDFINTDIDSLKMSRDVAMQHKAFQKILRNKYLGEVLVQDVILDRKYNTYLNGTRLSEDFKKLGFDNIMIKDRRIIDSVINRNKSNDLMVIDFLREIALKSESTQSRLISKFYIEYFDNNLNKTQDESISSTSINDLKNQIITLIAQKNELDVKIAKLSEQVNALQKGSITNGKK